MNAEFFKKISKPILIPDAHDGSYELMRRAIWAYANLRKSQKDWDKIDYKDLNLLLHLVIGTWKQGIESKKQSVQESHLDNYDKLALIKEIDEVWANAQAGKYSNMEGGKPSVGMFGTGIFSLKTKTDDNSVKKFFQLLVKIYFELGYKEVEDLSQNEKYYDMLETVFDDNFKGLGAASASQILHCFKPYIYPILNSASEKFYHDWGLKRITNIKDYAGNCKKINKVLLEHGIKTLNFRTLDLEAMKIKSDYQMAFEVWLSRQSMNNSEVINISNAICSVTDYLDDPNELDNLYEADSQKVTNCLLKMREKSENSFFDEENSSLLESIEKYEKFLEYFASSKENQEVMQFKGLLKWFTDQVRKNNDIIKGKHTSGQGYKGGIIRENYKQYREYKDFTLDCSIQGGMGKANKSNYIHLTDSWLNICPIFQKVSSKYDLQGFQIEIKPNNRIERHYSFVSCEELGLFNDEPANEKLKELFALFVNEIETYKYTNNNTPRIDTLQKNGEAKMSEELAKNIILYGPPGTGKTFNTVTYAVAIIENKDYNEIKFEAEKDYTQVKRRYEDYRSQGLIDFVTFHQSYGYEEFIEGIKPKTENGQITYDIKPGVFNEFCDRARSNITQKNYSAYGFNSSPTIWKVSLEGTGDNNTRRDCLQNGYIRIGFDSYGKIITDETIFKEGGKNVLNAFVNDMRIGDIIFSCFTNTTIDAIGVVTGDYEWQDRFEHYKRVRRVRWIYKGKKEIIDINGGKVMTLPTVYRLNISLDDVIKIVKSQDNEVRDFDFNLANAKKKNYVFIIDEINRGNISKIFGELITLIEDTKREGKDEAMSVKLPYSRKDFTIPDNVYIIGTMNTSDRSITTIDTALRRRFHFIEMMPDYSQLAGVVVDGIEILKMLEKMNNRIEALYDREHMIGHAYFSALKKNENINTLSEIFENKVIPLLQEYFYDDYEKIRLVLGDNQKSDNTLQFFNKAEINNLQLFGDNADELIADSRYTYSINKDAFKMPQAYRFVYEKAGMSEKQEI